MEKKELLKQYIEITDEVKGALENNRPLLALESTLIAHGFPYPDNLKLAKQMEDFIRRQGIIPAPIAILNGKIKVGLKQEEYEYIASSTEINKASIRDIPLLLVKKLDGGTTVAATMQIAALLGLKVFVTGGIGGVHYQGEKSFDISADLMALARFKVIVVSAGAKSVLDLAKTREVLESLGVPVLGYRCDSFPAFYLRDSGLKVDYRIDDLREVVEAFQFQEGTDNGGLLLTVPIPEGDELDKLVYQKIITQLHQEVVEKGIKGKRVTPFLLKELSHRTAGESVRANISLIMNNLKVGCQILKYYYGDEQ